MVFELKISLNLSKKKKKKKISLPSLNRKQNVINLVDLAKSITLRRANF